MYNPPEIHTRADDDCPWSVTPVHLNCAEHGYSRRTRSSRPTYAMVTYKDCLGDLFTIPMQEDEVAEFTNEIEADNGQVIEVAVDPKN